MPALGVPGGGAEGLRWIFVCGQPGSGKSTLIRQLAAELGPVRTQEISSDALADLLPEIYADPDDPDVQGARDAYQSGIRQSHIDALIERAVDLGVHVILGRPTPTNTAELAVIARTLGCRVECVVFAVPLVDSWLATLCRETGVVASKGVVPRRVAWVNQCVTYSRWPAFLARAEDQVAFDEIRIIDREGETFFTPFAFEFLMVERLHPRTAAQIEGLLADWEALRAHPDIAFRNLEAWPYASMVKVGQQMQAMRDDPGAAFDLNNPPKSRDQQAAAAWIARLHGEVDAVLNSPEAEGQTSLAGRCDRFVVLVERVAVQPTR
ncbi:MAG: hypothetical protein C0524_11260 [Rhodobacter sp.]|nr:hypothetical protein [Rhodobacter sp.]